MRIIGQFRDLDDPNRFVWFRGFHDKPTRAEALEAFYGGPVWKAHREVANSTMVDSDNVLLLRPVRSESGFSLGNNRPLPGAGKITKGLLVVTIYYFDKPPAEDFLEFFDREVTPVVTDAGSSILASFVTESGVNTFPKLPVRQGENVFMWVSRFKDQLMYDDHVAALARSSRWNGEVSDALASRLKGAPEVLRLSPTARSQLQA